MQTITCVNKYAHTYMSAPSQHMWHLGFSGPGEISVYNSTFSAIRMLLVHSKREDSGLGVHLDA